MSDIVERAKAALEGVTEGPWHWEDTDTLLSRTAITTWQTGGHPGWPKSTIKEHSKPTEVLSIEEYDRFLTGAEADYAFIAASRDLIPELLDALTAAEQKLEAIRDRCVNYTPSPDVVDEILAILEGPAVDGSNQ